MTEPEPGEPSTDEPVAGEPSTAEPRPDEPGGSAPRPTATGEALDDDMWWVRSLTGPGAPAVSPLLPTSERLRREVAGLPSSLAELSTEAEVRASVEGLNGRIRDWSRHLVTPEGAPTAGGIAPVDVDASVSRWEAARTSRDEPVARGGRRRPWRRAPRSVDGE